MTRNPLGGSWLVRHRSVVLCVLLVLVVLALHGHSVRNGFTSWDDNHYVTENPTVRAPTLGGIGRLFTSFQFCNYHPLTLLSFVGEHALVGLDPWLYHLDNTLLHAAVSVLVFLFTRRWLERDAPAFLGALLFAVHPLRVETVAWVAERKGLLCSVFLLGSLLLYTVHLDEHRGRARWAAYAGSLALFLGALLSKVLAIVLPGVMIALLLARRDIGVRRLLTIAPFGGLSILFAWLGIQAQAADNAIKGLHGGGLIPHALSVFKALGFYAAKMVVPVQLSPRYMLEPATGLLDPLALTGLALALGLGTAAVWSWRRSRTTFLGIAMAVATWIPVSGIVASSTLVADRYVYLPAIGLSLVLGDLTFRPSLRRVLGPVCGAFLLGCCVLTPIRVSVWRDSLTLWTDALRENPVNPFAFNQLSTAHLTAGRYGEAAAAAMDAARHGFARPGYLFNLCIAYRGLGDVSRELETARVILEGEGDFVPAWLVVLRHLIVEKRFEECQARIERLVEAHPDDAGLEAARGDLEAARGNLEGALLSYLRSIEMRAGDPEVLLSAAVILARRGDLERAIRTAESTASLAGDLSPGARERFHELAMRIEEQLGPQAGARVRELERGAAAKRDGNR